MLMEIEIAEKVLTVAGFAELTAANSKLFRQKVCAAFNGHTVVEIDLSETTFMDCAGLGALIAIRNSVRGKEIVVRLINPTSQVQQLLDIMRAGQILQIVNKCEETTPMTPPSETKPRGIRLRASLASEETLGALIGEEGLAPAIGY